MPADAIVTMLAITAFFALCAGVEAVALWLGWWDYDIPEEEDA